ncbi:alpha-glucoside-specific PTS transporter subunit IIBC [Garciella nitratireducens]|uniref:alpha-glucoside-specific PTS transporter subunit IIBC n=1 Tax=Garciella nitratireducens TaxID=218205 RepID=UPI000DE8FECC|nr:alpha-glucoside-specific PTS transporter subunit IIBC [Garciella nitratireducens]RBP41533.1 PTS system maltose-specific IIB component (Glc family) /PTS system maltose-specific IIC component (Glc family) [Garciella nitratireducens]
MMQKIQRFGAAMFVPVLLFPFAGILVGLTIVFKNPDIMGSLANPNGMWYKFWTVIEEGGWTVFRQIPLLFVIGLPIALAKKAQARACMEAVVSYLTFNYFISAILTIWGDSFGVDFSQEVGGVSGLTMIAGIKTLDTSMIGSILIAGIVVYLHNRYFDKKLPDFLGIFQGSSFVVIISFLVMLPMAFITSFIWPMIQHAIASMQGFLASSGVLGVWLYTFLERILIPTGLHHFIYGPFIYGPAVVESGIAVYWIEHLSEFATSAKSLKELFPAGGFALHGMSKIFGIPGIALAMYKTAKPEKKKMISGLLISATLTSVIAGITEPIEFTFLFIAPLLFVVHALLAATMSAAMYAFGVSGNMGGGLLEILSSNLIPLFPYHSHTYIIQLMIGLIFMGIYFFVFRYLILKLDIATPGREVEENEEVKLYSKAEYKAMKEKNKSGNAYIDQANAYLEALGGAENIVDVTNCATRLRVTVKDPSKIASDSVFKAAKAHGVVRNGKAIQIIVGLSVPQVREQFESILHQKNEKIGQ